LVGQDLWTVLNRSVLFGQLPPARRDVARSTSLKSPRGGHHKGFLPQLTPDL